MPWNVGRLWSESGASLRQAGYNSTVFTDIDLSIDPAAVRETLKLGITGDGGGAIFAVDVVPVQASPLCASRVCVMEALVQASASAVRGVWKVDVSLPSGEATVVYDPNQCSVRQIVEAIEAGGYAADLIQQSLSRVYHALANHMPARL